MQWLQHHFRQLLLLAPVLCLLMGQASAEAAENNLYKVTGIQVNEQSTNATVARTQAIEKGQEEALYVLLKRLTPVSMHVNLPKVDPAQVTPMVQEFEVKDEKITQNRYRAKLDVTFNPEYIKAFLSDNNIAFMGKKSPVMLLIPIMEKDGVVSLWGKDNLWWQAVEKAAQSSELLQTIMPMGDLEEISSILPETVLNGSYETLKPLAEKYKADAILIVNAQYQKPQNGGNGVKISVRTLRDGGGKTGMANFSSSPDQNEQLFLEAAARDIISRQENEWKNIAGRNEEATINLTITVPLNSAVQWANIKKRLEALKFLEKMEFKTISSRQATIHIAYQGVLETLLAQFNDHQFYLMEENNALILKSAL